MKSARSKKYFSIAQYHSPDFDFNGGNLIQSPCRNCPNRSLLPDCREGCRLICQVQCVLANEVGSGCAVDPNETYRVLMPV